MNKAKVKCEKEYANKQRKTLPIFFFYEVTILKLLCLVGIWLLFCGSALAGQKKNTGIIVRGAYWLKDVRVIQDMPKTFSSSQNVSAGAVSVGWDNRGSLGRFADKDRPFNVLIHNALPNAMDKRALSRGFPRGLPQPVRFLIGQQRLIVIANRRNSVEKITPAKMQQLLRKEDKEFKRQKLAESTAEVKCYGEGMNSWSRDAVRRKCMAFRKDYDWGHHDGWYPFRKNFENCISSDEVIKKVKSDTNGIGFLLYRPELNKALKGVKVLAVGKTDKGPFVTPKLEPVIQKNYPLAEPLILYLHPKAPPLAKKFCEFAVSEEGAKIAAEHGLITPWVEKHKVGKKRLREMKAGKGPKVRVVGAKGCGKLLDGLAVDYVMATAVIQMKFSAGEERAAVGRFATAGAKAAAGEKVSANSPQLLVLDGAMSEKTQDAYREKLAAAKPVRHVLGARGVAVIVNPKNPLNSITAEQVVEVFRGKAKSWADVAGAGPAGKTANGENTASGKMADGGKGDKKNKNNKNSQIVRYSPDPTKDAAVKYFHREILQANRCRGVQYRKTADSVIGFVASNPGGIGVIDVNDLAKTAAQTGVKVLAIGPAGKAALPTSKNLLAGKYPLARQVIMYVSPNADEATKDFVKFILTAEPSETFAKAGLVTTHSKITMPKPKPAKKKSAKGKAGKGKKSGKKDDKNKKLPKWKKDKEKSKDPGGW